MDGYALVFGSIDWEEYKANHPEISATQAEENDDLVGVETENLVYTYNSITNGGYCSSGRRINIDTSYSLEKKFAEQIHHPNYLGLRFINDRAKHIVHREYETTFNEYVKGISVHEYPLLRVKNCSQLIYRWIVPEKLKYVIRNLLQFVCDMHMNGKCLSDFNEDNLVVTQNNHWDFDEDSLKMVQKMSVMFWKIDFVEFTLEGRQKDMECLYDIIVKLFEPSSTPMDVAHFLRLLIRPVNENQWKSMEFYLKHHLSILTIKDRMLFMKSCNEKQKFMTNDKIRSCYTRALKSFSEKLDRAWRKRFEDDALGPMKLCFNYKPKENEQTPYPYESWMNPGILSCIRNTSTHLPDHIVSFKRYIMGTKFHVDFRMAMEVDAYMMYLFRKELLEFQSNLYDQCILEEMHR